MKFYLLWFIHFAIIFFFVNYVILKISILYKPIERFLLLIIRNHLDSVINGLDKVSNEDSKSPTIDKTVILKSVFLVLPILLILSPRILLALIHIRFFSSEKTAIITYNSNWLKIVSFLYSGRTRFEVFEPIVADWNEEYFEALLVKEIWKARWINVRYTYALLAAMWQKSPIGDLIEFISKFAK